MAIPRELTVAFTVECPRTSGEARGVTMARVQVRETRVDRKTRGVGGVYTVATFTAARVAARSVETRAVVKNAMMATWPAPRVTLINILAVSSISLKRN